MAITTTGGAGTITKAGGTTVTLFATPNTANAIFIVDIVETPASAADNSGTIKYRRIVGPNTTIVISDDPTGMIVTYSWCGLVIT